AFNECGNTCGVVSAGFQVLSRQVFNAKERNIHVCLSYRVARMDQLFFSRGLPSSTVGPIGAKMITIGKTTNLASLAVIGRIMAKPDIESSLRYLSGIRP